MNKHIYKVKCITNLHVGSGDINFNIVDNEVEKDPVTAFPTIHSSGLKGALRSQYYKENDEEKDIIFGKEGSKDGNSGCVKFLTAELLFQTVRAGDENSLYYLVTCKDILRKFADMQKTLFDNVNNIDALVDELEENKAYYFFNSEDLNEKGVKVDRFEYQCVKGNDNLWNKFISEFVDEKDRAKVIIIPTSDMKKIELPVIARNKLDEKGISQFLWYEEFVPHESIFYFITLSNNQKADEFFTGWLNNNHCIQIGGNASIGYGITCIEEVKMEVSKDNE